jgi:DNA-binding HxlR family transcriptional regulator
MSWDETSESVCDIARGLSVFGDRWTLLIMREISMGVRRFEDIQAQTGMSSNLLAMRLKRLEEDKMIERRQYSAHANRFEYFSTQKGKELDGVLLAIRAWSLRWGAPDPARPAVNLVYKKTGETIDALWHPPRNNRMFSFADTESSVSPAFFEERQAKVAAFRAKRERAVDTPVRKTAATAKKAAKSKTTSVKTAVRKTAAPAAKAVTPRTSSTPRASTATSKKQITAGKRLSKTA